MRRIAFCDLSDDKQVRIMDAATAPRRRTLKQARNHALAVLRRAERERRAKP